MKYQKYTELFGILTSLKPIQKRSILKQFIYLASRNIYGRSRISIWYKALKLTSLYWYYKGSKKKIKVTCRKCDDEYMAHAETVYYYDNTKCGYCYL